MKPPHMGTSLPSLAPRPCDEAGSLVPIAARAPCLVVASGDKATWASVKSAAMAGTNVYVKADAALAREAVFSLEKRRVYRAAVPKRPEFRCVGPNDLRWPGGVEIEAFASAPAGFEILGGGAFASGKVGGAKVVFCAIPQDAFDARRRKGESPEDTFAAWGASGAFAASDKDADARRTRNADGLRNSAAFSTERIARLHARIAANLGAQPAPEILARTLRVVAASTRERLPDLHVLGPFAARKDDSKHMLDTVWNEQVERMAIEGDFNPNFDFALPQGGKANWRPVLSADSAGRFNFEDAEPDGKKTDLAVWYATTTVERGEEGDATLFLGVDWRVRVWCNGEEVFRRERGVQGAEFMTKVHLKKGENVLSFKVGGGRAGCKLWAFLGGAPDGAGGGDEGDGATVLYDALAPAFDPYQFFYW